MQTVKIIIKTMDKRKRNSLHFSNDEDLPTTKYKPKYNFIRGEVPKFERLFSGIKENQFLREDEKLDWLK